MNDRKKKFLQRGGQYIRCLETGIFQDNQPMEKSPYYYCFAHLALSKKIKGSRSEQ